jgi:glutamine amidotransferase
MGAAVTLSRDPEVIAQADRLVVPGVGAFARCMDALRSRDLVEPIVAHARSGRPWLGICVGMQMMFESSQEFGDNHGLGLIAGQVVALPRVDGDGRPLKVPHIGWNQLQPVDGADWTATPLALTAPGTCTYFVHSFVAQPTDLAVRLAEVTYGGHALTVAVRQGNAFGVQFHPEKSGKAGLEIVKAFLAL